MDIFKLKIKITFPRTTGRQNKINTRYKNFKELFSLTGQFRKYKVINETFFPWNKQGYHSFCLFSNGFMIISITSQGNNILNLCFN